MRKQTFWFPTWSDTNQAVQLQKMARGLKFQTLKEDRLHYLCSENKGAEKYFHFYIYEILKYINRACYRNVGLLSS